jgi:hypothetical protein
MDAATPRLLVGVDPGLATGLAWLWNDTFTSENLSALDACDRIENLTRRHPGPIVVAVERYNITKQTTRMTRQYEALEVIGFCRWIARRHRASFLLQSAGEAQRAGNREVLRLLGWWKPGGDHLNKAAAQVALTYQRSFPLEFARRLEPGMII